MPLLRREPIRWSDLPAADLPRFAWLGDAVLLLYARDRIVRESGQLDNERCVRFTSNQFLSALGEPARVEAEIGRLYAESGMPAAVAWIETHLVPLFVKQEARRMRKRTPQIR